MGVDIAIPFDCHCRISDNPEQHRRVPNASFWIAVETARTKLFGKSEDLQLVGPKLLPFDIGPKPPLMKLANPTKQTVRIAIRLINLPNSAYVKETD